MPSVFFFVVVLVESLSDFIFSDVSHPQMSHQPVMFQRRLMSQLHNSSYPPPGILLSRAFFFLFFTLLYSVLLENNDRFAAEEDARPTLGVEPAPTPPRGSVSWVSHQSPTSPLHICPSLKALRLIF